jgi:hypothetical protein
LRCLRRRTTEGRGVTTSGTLLLVLFLFDHVCGGARDAAEGDSGDAGLGGGAGGGTHRGGGLVFRLRLRLGLGLGLSV